MGGSSPLKPKADSLDEAGVGRQLKGELCWLRISGPSSASNEQGYAMKRISSDPAAVLTVNDVARYLKVNPGTVYRLLRTGKLPGFRVGSDWRFRREEVDRWRVESERKPDT
jgi:excisionase family DNA binding protein